MQDEPKIPNEPFNDPQIHRGDPFRVISWDPVTGRLCVRFWTGDELVVEPEGPKELDVTLVPQKRGNERPSEDLSDEQAYKATLLKNLFLYERYQPSTSPANEPDPDVTISINHAVVLAADADDIAGVRLRSARQTGPQEGSWKDWTLDLAQEDPRENGYPGPLTDSANDEGWVTAPCTLLTAYLIAYSGEKVTLDGSKIWERFEPWAPKPDDKTYEIMGEHCTNPNPDPIGRSFPNVYEEHGKALTRYLRALWYIKEYDTETVFKPLAR